MPCLMQNLPYRSYRAKYYVRAYLAGPNVISAIVAAGLKCRHPAATSPDPGVSATVACGVAAIAVSMLFDSIVPFPGATIVTWHRMCMDCLSSSDRFQWRYWNWLN